MGSKIWDKNWHEVFAKISIYFSKNNSQGGPHGTVFDFKSHANLLIGLGNLPTFFLKKSIPFINNPLQISPEIPNSLSQNLLLLSSPFRSAVNGKGWMSSRANSLKMPDVLVYGPRPKPSIVVRSLKRGKRSPGRSSKPSSMTPLSWLMPLHRKTLRIYGTVGRSWPWTALKSICRPPRRFDKPSIRKAASTTRVKAITRRAWSVRLAMSSAVFRWPERFPH